MRLGKVVLFCQQTKWNMPSDVIKSHKIAEKSLMPSGQLLEYVRFWFYNCSHAATENLRVIAIGNHIFTFGSSKRQYWYSMCMECDARHSIFISSNLNVVLSCQWKAGRVCRIICSSIKKPIASYNCQIFGPKSVHVCFHISFTFPPPPFLLNLLSFVCSFVHITFR